MLLLDFSAITPNDEEICMTKNINENNESNKTYDKRFIEIWKMRMNL